MAAAPRLDIWSGLLAPHGVAPAYYRVHGYDEGGHRLQPSDGDTSLRIPTASTPNGDGLDNTWQIERIGNFNGNQVLIFNRWGNKIFETWYYQRGNEWDSSMQGQPAPVGTYYYIMLETGRSYAGSVTVVR